jgi:hypothetical protein
LFYEAAKVMGIFVEPVAKVWRPLAVTMTAKIECVAAEARTQSYADDVPCMCVEAASMYEHDGLFGRTSPVEVVEAYPVQQDFPIAWENDLVNSDARYAYDGPEMIEFIGKVRSNRAMIPRNCCVIGWQ